MCLVLVRIGVRVGVGAGGSQTSLEAALGAGGGVSVGVGTRGEEIPGRAGPRYILSCRRDKRCRPCVPTAPWLLAERSGRTTAGRGAAYARLRPLSADWAAPEPDVPCWGWPWKSAGSCWLCCCSCWVSIDGGAASWAGVEASERADMEVMGGVSERTGFIPRFSSFPPTAVPCRPRSRLSPERPHRPLARTGISGLSTRTTMSAPHSNNSPHDQAPLPPVPFDDFQFFNSALNGIAPPPPPLPPSNELFSQSETTDLFGFLENFDWDFSIDGLPQLPDLPTDPLYQPPIQDTAPPGLDQLPSSSNLFSSQPEQQPPSSHTPTQPPHAQHVDTKPRTRTRSRSPSSSSSPASQGTPSAAGPRVKPLLSTPQKRLNHIMSEQKRRNAIRDGYLQLTTLLAPAGAPPGTGMPTRGRPKGSGSRGRGTKGKSGILFRAKEYINWLEEGRDALLEEVTKLETAAGIR